MTSSISSQLVSMQNATSMQEAKTKAETGASQDLGQDTFLKLMMEELQYQDPLEPMDNSEFLTQQAQFTQVSSLQNLETYMSSYNEYSQAASMMGKDVVIQDPNNEDNYLYGNVEAVNLSSTSPTVVVDGTSYPLSSIVQVQAQTLDTTNTSDNN